MKRESTSKREERVESDKLVQFTAAASAVGLVALYALCSKTTINDYTDSPQVFHKNIKIMYLGSVY